MKMIWLIGFEESYFKQEQIESLIFIILGILSICLALIFLGIIKYSFFKGMAVPLLAVGLIQLIVGTTIYLRSPEDKYRVTQMLINERSKIKTEEIPRMEKVMQNFTVYKWIEIVLILASIILLIIFYSSPQTYWKGLALGLLIQAIMMLSLDVLAENRGQVYIEQLQKISKR
jgi:predicted membrane channel-forming protein YqfA (hemolysin III family)